MRTLKGFIHNILSSTPNIHFTKVTHKKKQQKQKEMKLFRMHTLKRMKSFSFFLKLQENANKA